MILLVRNSFKSSSLFLLLFLCCSTSFAQPPNDDPCTATLLTANNNCNYQVFSTVGATASVGVPAPGCANYLGGDIWFKVAVPCSGNLSFDTNFGVVLDGGMAAYSGDCSNLTLLSCDDNSSPNGQMPQISLTGLTFGDTIWVRFWENGNNVFGTMGICAGIPPPPPPGASCETAGPFCTGTVYDFPNITTNPDGLGGQGIYTCLGSTPNPVFYYMQIENPGDLTIHITQQNAAGNGLDVDFTCWGPFPDLASMCTGLAAANTVSCSFSPDPEEDCIITNAQTGEFYMLLLTNFSLQPGFIHFEQSGGAASTNCGILCSVTAANTGPVCPGQTVDLTSTLGGPVPGGIFTWTGPNCFSSHVQNPAAVTPPSTPGSYNYTITVATGQGTSCNATTTVVVANGLSGGSATPAGTSCPAANNGTITVNPPASGGPFTFTLNPGNIVHANNNPTYNNLPAGTYSILISNGNCDQTISNIVVPVGAAPTGTAVPINATCAGASNGTITITPPAAGGPFIYTLNPGNIVHNNNPVYTGLDAATYTITFTNAAGCNGTITTNPVVNNGPNPTATAVPENTTCPSLNNGTITITPPATGGPFVYTLNPGNIVHNNNPVYTGLAATTYTITFTTAQGCSGTISPTIVSNGPAPTATAVPTNTLCPTVSNGTITITPPAAGGPFTYTLNPGNIVQNNNPVYTGLAAATYTITFTTAAGCNGTMLSNPQVANGAAPTATAVTANTSCPTASNGTITITPPAIGGPFVYTLNPGNVVHNNNPVYTGLAAGTYTITFTTATGCNGQVGPNNPVVLNGPALTANAPTLFNPPCANINDGRITIVPSIAATYTYILNPGTAGQINNGNNPTFTGLAPGTYTYNFTNAAGCIFTGSATLTTHAALGISIVKTMPLCFGGNNGTITLSASGGLAAYKYALSPFTVFQSGGTFNNLTAGTYTFRVKDNAGCTKDTTVTLGQPTLLTASAVTTPATCNGNDGQITVTGNAGTPGYTYSVDGISYQSSQNFTVTGTPGTGISYPGISVQDNNGCIATALPVSVTAIDNMLPLFIGNDTTICAEQHVTFHPQTSSQASVFLWTTLPDPSLINTLDNNTIENATASPLDTTTYVLTAEWGVCTRTDNITINLLHKPIAYAGEDTAVCFDKTIAVLHGSASNLSGTVNYEWSDTTNLQTPHVAVTIATPPKTEPFILTVTDNYGCNFSVTDRVTVFVQPPVPAFAGNDTIAVIGQPHQLLATGGETYIWTPANDLNFSNIANPLATLNHDQLFQVTVIDKAGCIGNDKVYVQVYPGPAYHIPTAFSPNGDGLNDIFRVIPAGIAYTDWFRIFNRYGEMVFETNQWLKGWDGTFQGKKQPVGNYVWVLKGLDKNGKKIEMKGSVMLIQ